ncbi:MAG: AI-2E family transporter [Ignavibacteriae bacterium]|nr:AI-2E family transporter [Ignavibacteriota bacterium]
MAKRPSRKRVLDAITSAGEQTPSRTVPEMVIIVTALVILVALGYSVYPIISPFVLVGGLVYLLYPLREQQLAGRMMWLSIFIFLIWFFYSILGLLVPFIIAFLISYLLNPVVTRLEARGVPRWASSLAAVLAMIGIVVGVLLFILPIAMQQFQGILSGIGNIAEDISEMLKTGSIFEALARYGVPVERAQEFISHQVTPRLENVLTNLFEGAFGFVTGLSSVILHVINAIIIPFLVFYILMDFRDILVTIGGLVPLRRQERVFEIASKVDKLMGKYLRGAITVALIQATISATALWLIGVRFALVLGLMTGMLNFIPYVGLITSLIVSCIVALFSDDPVTPKVIAVVVLYLSQKLLEATVLAPKIIGTQVGLHPVLLILCLLVFGYFLGFVGLLIAVPATALLMAGVKEWELKRAAPEVANERM